MFSCLFPNWCIIYLDLFMFKEFIDFQPFVYLA